MDHQFFSYYARISVKVLALEIVLISYPLDFLGI